MKIKVSLCDLKLLKEFSAILSVISTIFSLFLISYNIPDKYKGLNSAILFSLAIFILYLVFWLQKNTKQALNLNINGNNVHIKYGDLFTAEGIKIISFNEYFDTTVNDKIIAHNTINGKFIDEGLYIHDDIKNIHDLDNFIVGNIHLRKNIVGQNFERNLGKNIQYKLGSVIEICPDYLAMAFSRFDEENKAYLSINDFINCLLFFWSEIARVYNARSIVLPLLGGGILRIKNCPLTKQELLEILLLTFKLSKISLAHSTSLTIVMPPSLKDEVNFYKLDWVMG